MDNISTLGIKRNTVFAQIPRWIIRAEGNLSHSAVHLYGAIMSYADNETLTAFPAREALAKDIGASVATVKRAIKELEQFGAIEVLRRRNKSTGNFYANHYTLIFDCPWVTGDPPPKVTGDPVTRPTTKLDPLENSFTTTPAVQRKKSSTPKGKFARSANAEPHKRPEPIADEDEWIYLRDKLMRTAQITKAGHSFFSELAQAAWEQFGIAMRLVVGDESYEARYADFIDNNAYTVGPGQATAVGAGAKLTKLMNDANKL